MAVVVIDTIKPKNQGTFPIVEAADVKVTNDKRLDSALNEKANASTVEALSTAVAGKASQSDLTTLSNTVADKADKSALAETNTAVAGKQAALTEAQLAACNSGITSELTEQIGLNTTAIEGKASAADVTALASEVDDKADSSDVTVAVNDLQGQINQIVISASAESVVAPEVAAARVNASGVEFPTLKAREDSADNKIATVMTVGNFTESGWINGANGSFNSQAASSLNFATPYIEINSVNKIKYKTYCVAVTDAQTGTVTKSAAIAFYDSEKAFISAITLDESGIAEGVATPPANARYIRAANWGMTAGGAITEPLCLVYISSDLVLSKITEVNSQITTACTDGDNNVFPTIKSRLDNADNKFKAAITNCSFSEKGWINAATGAFNAQSGSEINYATPFIEIDQLTNIYYKTYVVVTQDAATAAVAFYDSEKVFISAITLAESGVAEGVATIPSNAAYFRAANWGIFRNPALVEPICLVYLTADKILDVIDNVKDSINNKEIYADFTIDGYLNGLGQFVSSNMAHICDYQAIHSSTSKIYYKLYSNDTSTDEVRYKIGLVTFYTANKAIISTFYDTDTTGFAEGYLSVPQGAAFYRATKWIRPDDSDNYCYEKFSTDDYMETTDDHLTSIDNQLAEIKNNSKVIKYWETDSLNKPFDFENKNIVAFGDSITYGVSSPNLVRVTPYIGRFATQANATLALNRAVSGSCITDLSETSIYSKVMDYSDDTDFIVVSGGTNDFNTSKEIGTYADVLDTSDATTVTLYACLKAMCAHLAQKTATVIFITPIPYTSAYIERFNLENGNSLGYYLDDYRKAIYEVATAYGFNVVDGASLGMPTIKGGWGNTMCDDTDGCHPTDAGHSLYARSLAGKLL